MGKSPGIKDESRRGSGRTMATLMAAQLWAMETGVAVFLYRPDELHTKGMVGRWLETLHPTFAGRIKVFHADSLERVDEQLRGCRFGKVFVDHHIFERSEDMLERRIQALRNEHERHNTDKETIR